jgi:hypothetical protein
MELLRYLLIRLSEHWDSYQAYNWQPGVPCTNNGTEQVIGKMKICFRFISLDWVETCSSFAYFHNLPTAAALP